MIVRHNKYSFKTNKKTTMNLCMHEWVCVFVCVVLERRKISLERQMTTIKGNKDICQHTTMATCKKFNSAKIGGRCNS